VADWVLDSSAVLAWLHKEPGHKLVASALPDSLISSVNLAEVVTKLVDRGRPEQEAFSIATLGGYEIVALDEALALRTGGLRALTRHLGLTLGDRACLALAEREGLPLFTADRAWAGLDIGVQIRLIR
jgi:ribonuclease VapC